MALGRRSKGAQSDFFPGFADVVEIGIGSLATVYRAREVGTNRLVALKLLNVRDASPRAIESFERESIALGAVSSHPNIVTLFRSFRAGDGRPVLVLELCSGSIGDRMRDGHGLPVPEVVSLGIKIAGALETAHRAEILHRDVKPQNILMTEFGEPALADFGVAMLQSSTQTTAGLFDFTTLHAAPELLEGGATSAATDVYELASSLYQLTAGRSAFRAYDGESPASVILRILRDPVQPLVNAQVPAELSDLLVYAMSKDKDSRPPTAAEFAAELAAIEVAQGWPRTQFLIRDPAAPGGSAAYPTITRMPMLHTPNRPPVGLVGAPPPALPVPMAPPAPVPAAPPAPVPQPYSPAPVDEGWSTTTVSGHAAPDEALVAPVAPPAVAPMAGPPPDKVAPADFTPRRPPPVVLPRPVELPAEAEPWSPPPPLATAPAPAPALDTAPEPTRLVPTYVPPAAPEPEPEVVEPEVVEPEVVEPEVVEVEIVEPPASQQIVLERVVVERAEWIQTSRVEPRPAEPAPPLLAPEPPAISAPMLRSPFAPPPPPEPFVSDEFVGGPPGFDAPPIEAPPAEPVPPEFAPATFGWAPVTTDAPPPPEPAPSIVPWRDAEPGHDSDPGSRDADQHPGPAVQYPIPPPAMTGEATSGSVPTWAFRAAPAAPPSANMPMNDLTLDPMSLRSRVTIRSGAASLKVDAERLVSRQWLHRSDIEWSDVLGFEPRFEGEGGAGAGGRLVAITRGGPVELPATKRSPADLRYIHALLDAYRQRALLAPR